MIEPTLDDQITALRWICNCAEAATVEIPANSDGLPILRSILAKLEAEKATATDATTKE